MEVVAIFVLVLALVGTRLLDEQPAPVIWDENDNHQGRG